MLMAHGSHPWHRHLMLQPSSMLLIFIILIAWAVSYSQAPISLHPHSHIALGSLLHSHLVLTLLPRWRTGMVRIVCQWCTSWGLRQRPFQLTKHGYYSPRFPLLVFLEIVFLHSSSSLLSPLFARDSLCLCWVCVVAPCLSLRHRRFKIRVRVGLQCMWIGSPCIVKKCYVLLSSSEGSILTSGTVDARFSFRGSNVCYQ